MPRVELTRHLFAFFPHLTHRDLEVEASTVREAIAALERLAPGIAFYICDERGSLRPHVNVFIGDERVVDRKGLTDRLRPNDRLFILQALSGG